MIKCSGLTFQNRQIMYRIEDHAFLSPKTLVSCNESVLVEDIYSLDVPFHHHRMVCPFRGNGIVVGVEAYEGQGRCGGGLLHTGVKRSDRQRPEMGFILN